ncbi:MAG: DUF1565 domain-containing protein [Chitinivibrionales bacterium]|nr:DUF1565 domain-containing protein [Chitinivibrionales bacterium]MBD3395408.1 DUF1565 domain-containing protein [Chitinivibrionales bacterium]
MNTRRLVVFLLTAVVTVSARDIHVSPSGSDAGSGNEGAPYATIGKAIDEAQAGDHIHVANGTYAETLLFPEDKSGEIDNPIVLEGESRDGVIVDGEDSRETCLLSTGADYVHVKKMSFKNAACESFQAEQAAVRLESFDPDWYPSKDDLGEYYDRGSHGWLLQDLLIEGNRGVGLGLCLTTDVTVERVESCYNFATGLSGPHNGGLTVRQCEIHHNCCGWDYNAWPGEAAIVEMGGKYYPNGHWEAGGSKMTWTRSAVFDHHLAYENHGSGLWFDIDNENVIVSNSEFHSNRNVPAGNNSGRGLFMEINPIGNFTVDNCLIHDNDGYGMEIAESQNITVNNTFFRNDALGFRDMNERDDGTNGLHVEHIEIQHNIFQDGQIMAGWSCEDWTRQTITDRDITIDYNTWESTPAYVSWGNYAECNGIEECRSKLGIGMNSTESGDWTEWDPGDVHIRPGISLRAPLAPAMPDRNAAVFSLNGRYLGTRRELRLQMQGRNACGAGVFVTRAHGTMHIIR